MSKKHKHKNKCKCTGDHENCKCHKGCDCHNTEHIFINSEEEMYALINLIVKHGESKMEQRQKMSLTLSNAMIADSGINFADIVGSEPSDLTNDESGVLI